MSPKSKKVYASKSKSRTAKKGGWNPFASWSVFSNKPSTPEKTDGQGNTQPITEPAKVDTPPESVPEKLDTPPVNPPLKGGKRRSRKSCKSKKHSKTNKHKCK